MANPQKRPTWFAVLTKDIKTADFRKLLDKKKKEDKNVSNWINEKDEDGYTALHLACKLLRKDVVEILLSERADPSLVDKAYYTPLIVACNEPSNEDIIRLLLSQPGVDVTKRNVDGSTALHYFAKCYNSPASEEVYRLLLQKGAPVNEQNHRGETPLLHAMLPLSNDTVRPATARLMLESGANPNIADNNGEVPLHRAAVFADQELIALFLSKGADPTVRPRLGMYAGKLPSDVAAAKNRPNIASTLRQAEQRWTRQKEFEQWLEENDLAQYLPKFQKEEFDMTSLWGIDDALLNTMGIPAGKRIAFFQARDKLEKQRREKSNPPAPAMAERKPTNTLLPSTHIINFSDITMGRLLGKGFFAEVREGEYRGSPIAVKIIYRESFRNKGDIELFYQEAEILSKLRFPTVVQFIGICVGEQHCIITEFMKDGSLYQKLHDYPDEILRNQKWQLQIALDIARGMNYLHRLEPPVLHRDLTSKNILLDGKTAKVADFGLSKEKDLAAAMTSSVGALPWAAPEVFKGAQFTESADTYSYGVIVWELWSGKDPQGDLPPLAFANKVAHESFRPPIAPNTPPRIADLIVRCWDADAHKRPSFDEIIKYLKAIEADRHGKKDKQEKERSGKKSRAPEPLKSSSDVDLLAQYGGGSSTSVSGTSVSSTDSALLAQYGQQDSPKGGGGDMYINSTGLSSSKGAESEFNKSSSSEHLRLTNTDRHSNGLVLKTNSESSDLSNSRGKNDVLIKASGSGASASDSDLMLSNKLRMSSAVNVPTIAIPPGTQAPAPSSGGELGGRMMANNNRLRQLHERNGPVIFHNPSSSKSNDASPTHLRRVSMDDGNRSPLKESREREKADSPKSKP